jgi:hypothetical protein
LSKVSISSRTRRGEGLRSSAPRSFVFSRVTLDARGEGGMTGVGVCLVVVGFRVLLKPRHPVRLVTGEVHGEVASACLRALEFDCADDALEDPIFFAWLGNTRVGLTLLRPSLLSPISESDEA